MIIKILLIALLFRATTSQASKIADENSEKQDNTCVNSTELCSPDRNNICCDPNEKCEFIEWRLIKAVHACKIPTKLGSNCTSNSDCLKITNAFCDKKHQCQCSSYFIETNNNECALPNVIPCTTSYDCPMRNAVCNNERCVCKPKFFRRKDRCEPTSLGQSCWEDSDCIDILHMECSENRICACKPNHVIEDDVRCVSLLGKFCSIDHDCGNLMHVKCKENKCVCRPHHSLVLNSVCLSRLGGFCQNDKECGASNSICVDNECKCKHKYTIATPDRCVFTPLGSHCLHDDDCREILHTKCSDNETCVCRNNYLVVNGTTCGSILGERCFNDEPCAPANSVCKGYPPVCQCKDSFKSISNQNCVPTMFGKPCHNPLDCEDILHLQCLNNKCQCKDNHVIVSKSVCAPLLDEYCWNYEKCAPEHSMCIGNTCQCKFGYKQQSNNRCVLAKLGLPCKSNEECEELMHAQCSKNNVCECRENNIFNEDSKTCAPAIGGYCDIKIQCNDYNSICRNNTCQYREGIL